MKEKLWIHGNIPISILFVTGRKSIFNLQLTFKARGYSLIPLGQMHLCVFLDNFYRRLSSMHFPLTFPCALHFWFVLLKISFKYKTRRRLRSFSITWQSSGQRVFHQVLRRNVAVSYRFGQEFEPIWSCLAGQRHSRRSPCSSSFFVYL